MACSQLFHLNDFRNFQINFTPSQLSALLYLWQLLWITPQVISVLSSTPLPGFSGGNFNTTTGSSATLQSILPFLNLFLSGNILITLELYRASPVNDCSLWMIPSSSTSAVCLSIGLYLITQACPLLQPNQVRFRYVPFTSYRFLQTLPLPETPLRFRLISPQTGYLHSLSSGRGYSFAGQT